jgi:class 3 adenylate cyclase
MEILPSHIHNFHSLTETTIFFMDLVGFTQWSSTRQPVQVFELLEAIYTEFDKIALRRKVFVSVACVFWFEF